MAASRGQHHRHRVCLLLLLVLFTCPSSPPASAQAARSFTVLALHMASDDPGSATANLVWYSTIRDVLKARAQRPVDVFQEFVPVDGLVSEEATLALRDYLRERYRGRRPDLVIAYASLARRLHSATGRVYVLVGRSPRAVPRLRAELDPIAGDVPVTYIAELSVPEMLDAVKHLPADSLIFYINYVQETRGHTPTGAA